MIRLYLTENEVAHEPAARFNMGLQPYTESYKRHRKAFHHGFNKRVSDEYQYLQTVRKVPFS